MYRIDENTWIDTSLITCAEYQIFIDEKRAQGQYFQPDHWKSYQFPSGWAKAPVFGVRSRDASAFCEWLTMREAGEWRYRLPDSEEASIQPIQDIHFAPSGYWVSGSNETEFGWINLVNQIKSPMDLNFERTRALGSALNLASSTALDRDLAKASDLDRVLVLALSYNQASANASYRSLDRDLIRDRALDRARVRARAIDLAITLASILTRALYLVSAQKRIPAHVLEYSHHPDIDSEVANTLDLVRELDLANNLDFAKESDIRHSLIRNLDRVRDLALHRSSVGDLARARDLTNILASTLDLIIPLSSENGNDLSRARDLVITLNLDLTINQARNLEVDRILALYLDLDLDLTRVLTHTFSSNHQLAGALSQALARTLASDHALARILISDRDLNQAHDLAGILTRAIASILASQGNLASDRDIDTIFAAHILAREDEDSGNLELIRLYSTFITDLIDISLNCMLLQWRIDNAYPSFEGIRIVKERKPDWE